jgi:hypothetical protein
LRSPGHQNRTTSLTIGPRSRKIQALAMMLVLCLVTFVVLAGGEAWAAEQPSQTTQLGTVQTTTTINGKVTEPVAGVTPPVETPPVETPPVETPPVETPPVETPSAEKPPTKEPAPPPPPTTEETPPAEEPSSPPVEPAPSTPEPEPAPQPAPQWFAVVITDGEIVESDPVVTSWSVTDFGWELEPEPMPNASPDVIDPALDPAAAPAADGYASEPTPDAEPAVPDWEDAPPPVDMAPDPVLPVLGPAAASEQVPPDSGLAGLVRGLVADPVAPRGDGGGPLPQSTLLKEIKEAPTTALATALATTLLGTGPDSAAPAKNAPANNAPAKNAPANNAPANNAAPAARLTPSAPTPTVPASVGGALRLPSSLGATAAGAAVGTAVESVRSAAASVATEVLGTLAGGSPGLSSTNSTDGTQEDQPSEGTTPQQAPAPPLTPVGGSSFSPSTGGGQLGTGGSFAPLLVGILALLATSLLRCDFRTYLISCEMPKPSSALLMPLERPG